MQLDRKHFEGIYSRFLESGLTFKDYCSNEGLAPSKFYYCQKGVRPSPHPLVHNGFLSLSIDTPLNDRSGIPGMENPFEITYPGGIILPEGSFHLPYINANTGALHTSWQNLIGVLRNVVKNLIFKRMKW